MDIEHELKKFNVTEATLAELKQQYMPLMVNGIDDKQGLKLVKEARLIVKRYRIDIDKRRKELTADALELQRRINGEAKRVTAMLEPIELHLLAEEKKIDDEIERIKREKEETQTILFNTRVNRLNELNFMFDGIKFYTNYLDTFNSEIIQVSVLYLKQWDDKTFNDFFNNAKHYFDIEKKVAAEKAYRDEAERKALAEERARLGAIAKEQAEKEAALKAEAERIESLKRDEENKTAIINSEKELEQSFVCTKKDVNPINDTLPEPEFAEVEEKIINIRSRINIQHYIKQGRLEEGRQYAVDCFFEHLKQVIKKENDLEDFADLYCLNE